MEENEEVSSTGSSKTLLGAEDFQTEPNRPITLHYGPCASTITSNTAMNLDSVCVCVCVFAMSDVFSAQRDDTAPFGHRCQNLARMFHFTVEC